MGSLWVLRGEECCWAGRSRMRVLLVGVLRGKGAVKRCMAGMVVL